MSGPREPGNRPAPPPLRIIRHGWFTWRELTKAEAEAYWLRQAAKHAGKPDRLSDVITARREAQLNRLWIEHEEENGRTTAPPLGVWS